MSQQYLSTFSSQSLPQHGERNSPRGRGTGPATTEGTPDDNNIRHIQALSPQLTGQPQTPIQNREEVHGPQ
jgi:hypothetical protein